MTPGWHARRGAGNDGCLARSSFEAFGKLIVALRAAGTIYYDMTSRLPHVDQSKRRQTPLDLEIRLPAGATLSKSEQGIAIELRNDINTMHGE